MDLEVKRPKKKEQEFWEALSECLNGSEERETIVILSDMNASVVDRKECD
jgi:hypothetical protein